MGAAADYEARVLKSAIYNPSEVLHKVVYTLNEIDFSNDTWRHAFNVLRKAAEKGKQTTTALIDALSEAHCPTEAIIDCWGGTYGADDIKEPMETVVNRSRLKRLKREYVTWIAEVGHIDTDSNKHLMKVINQLSALFRNSHTLTLDEQIGQLVNQRAKYTNKDYFGLQTDLDSLDWITRGMQPQHLWMVGGYTSVGKSWFAIYVARKFIEAGQRVLYLSFEMSAEEILWRLTCQIINDPAISINRAKSGMGLDDEQKETVTETIENLRQAPMDLVDQVSTWDEARLVILHHIFAKNVDCIIFDYLQNCIVPKSHSEYESLNTMVRDLQRMAVENNVFVLALSQINRESQKNETDKVFGFKGSGNLENAADVAITIRKFGETPQEREKRREVVVGKNRTGNIGTFICDVDFERGYIGEPRTHPTPPAAAQLPDD